ncbi:uncharacterized protein A4U43_C08F23530 [Asparagus officinalis]|uniref:galactoside 2-alpha-L-fucosyltransferase-like n=1 Tax=Asparagus officinalis TaxID=4686 RepID=UPI00098E864B|nr:galactoside 2-alpha-L-fucosyltransferase-like [Asparagus officinalis]ONK60866.1 uncharacterized protein A4U43_C08F23530 [Asparagus officinalis]
MDMKRIRTQRHPSPNAPLDLEESDGAGARAPMEKRPNLGKLRLIIVLVGFLVLLPLLVAISGFHRSLPLDQLQGAAERGKFEVRTEQGSEEASFAPPETPKDTLLGGLLAPGFDQDSCLSRYQSVFYHKASKYSPSPYLLERLRKYEALHRKCGPNTELYNKTIHKLKSGQSTETTECNYVVWISHSGLGNRILTLASTYLYALLTNRILLVDRGADMADLFCEPFPDISWLLPLDFPLNPVNNFNEKSTESYGIMVKDKDLSGKSPPSHVYLHLAHDYGDFDKLFFCEADQDFLKKVPWLVLRSDNYFVPSLFLIPKYEEELHRLFPQRDTVFHHLGRYLFHPTNIVWGLITRYYEAYLAKADEILGIQIRVFDIGTGPFEHVLDQIIACTQNEKLLPEVSKNNVATPTTPVKRSKAVLMTSLSSGYFETIRNMYWENPTFNGEIVSVYQPSHEEYQQTEKQMHNMKAWAEMYLLSFSDSLVTSSWSTFGYVAQGLGGLKPWILVKPENRTTPDPPCGRAMSMDPCFHAPPFYDCKAKRGIDTGALVPHVRHCEDMSWGLKLVDTDEW